jgi:CRISPR-associated exonuclease Cas4
MWLHANEIKMESNSEHVAMGKVIEEFSYDQRSTKYEQILIGGAKIDFYDAKNKVIHEVKKSSKFHETHIWQIKFYIFTLEQAGIEGVVGILEYPKERKKEEVYLSDRDRDELIEIQFKIQEIIQSEEIPDRVEMKRCKNCSYFDFCYC